MNILLINCAYKQGSTGKIVECISSSLRNYGHSVFTCYGVGEDFIDNYSEKVCSGIEHTLNAFRYRIDGLPYGGIHWSNKRIKDIITKFNPDIVNIHCINASMVNIYNLLKYLAHNNIKTVVSLHAEFMHTGGCDHAFDCEQWKTQCTKCPTYKQKLNTWLFDRAKTGWERMYNAFSGFKTNNIIITAVSPWLAQRAKNSSILGSFNICYVPNGLNQTIFKPTIGKSLINRDNYDKIILFVTPYFSCNETDLKGGRYITKLAEMRPKYKFVIVCSRLAQNIPTMPKNVHIFGRANSQVELAQLYTEADISIVLSKRETFSMVTAESLCCGTPVIGFEAGGPESIAIEGYSKFVEYGDVHALINAIDSLNISQEEAINISHKAIAAYSMEHMTSEYLKVYNSLINSNDRRI